jgi:chromosome segregation ATPase
VSTSIVVAYPFTPEDLAAKVDVFRGHIFTTPALYREGTKAIATCREMRVAIEERRKLLKQDSLEYGRKVDAVAKQLVDIIEAVEKPLKAAKTEVDQEKARAKEAAAAAERKAIEDDLRIRRQAEEDALREQRKAEEARLAEERKAIEAERAAAAAERKALEEERAAAAKELAEIRARKAKEQSEREARELAERMATEAEERRIHDLEYAEAQKKRLAALAPDREKLKTFRVCIDDLLRRAGEWKCSDADLERARTDAVRWLMDASSHLRDLES